MAKMFEDWRWIWFSVPSALSFVCSLAVMLRVMWDRTNSTKRFYQLVVVISILDILQCLSCFIGPRYDQHTYLCEVQEYMFQFSTLMKSITSVIICTTIYNAIKYGRVIDMWDQSVLSWIVFGVGVTILSISYDTAELFCPFNFEHSMYYKNIPLSSPRLDRLVVYGCCYLFPVTLCFSFNCLYSWRSHQHARSLHVGSITAVARQLLMYPIVLGIAICPLFLFVFLTILTGHEVRPLLYIGAIIVSSVGTANAFVFFRIVHANRNSWRQNSNFVTDTKHTSTHSMAATFLTPNHSELSSINATQNGSSELSDLLYEVGD